MTAALIVLVAAAAIVSIACLPWTKEQWEQYVQAAAWCGDWLCRSWWARRVGLAVQVLADYLRGVSR